MLSRDVFCGTMNVIRILLFLAISSCWLEASEDGVRFATDIQPLFAQKCLECHGPDKQKGDLRLDKAGEIDTAELIRRITTADEDDRMPPKGEPLKSGEIDALNAWIKAGAKFEQHWAYAPPNPGAPPAVKNEAWLHNNIDRFVLARLEESGIVPAPEADRYTLIKRLFYDLIGLPPTPEQVDAFVADKSDEAYAKVVQQLLSSKHFGERWGRHWLDKARYADSDGYEKDRPRLNAWHFRDWVINAVNADMPLDQFTIEQLAGDLLPEPTDMQHLATAFHRQTLTNTEGGTDQEQFRVEATFDRTETTGTIWLGLTVGCARCHSHKYDAITHEEYYRLFAFFNNGDETNFKLPNSAEAMEKYGALMKLHDAKVAKLNGELKIAGAGHEAAFETWRTGLEQLLAANEPPKFHGLTEIAAVSDVEGVVLAAEKDGVVHVSGKVPAAAVTYEISAKSASVSTPVTGIRIDVLPDKRLPGSGPGRAENGNFVLTEFEAYLGEQKLAFAGASGDFAQGGFPVSNLVDGVVDDKNGWAVGGQVGKPHHSILRLAKPLDLKVGGSLTFKLIQNYLTPHTLGRFQIRLMTGLDSDSGVPKEIQTILAPETGKRNAKQNQQLLDHFKQSVFEPTKAVYAKITALTKAAPKEPVTPIRVIAQRPDLRETKVLERGDFLSPAEPVSEGGLSTLPPVLSRAEGKPDRLDLANWLMSEENPLPPRVLTNHVWTQLFGEGLVRTNNDFGVRGELPSHPKLLDWLGLEFRRLGWSRKKMVETIVMSATYRQASAHRAELLEIDPNNRLLARQNRFRVQAEIVRDLCLSVSGLFSDKVGGPSVFPPLPPDVALLSYNNNFKWATSAGEDRYRRGMYTFFKRTSPHPNLIAFDCPDSNTTNVIRRTSNTPIQALTTLNNEVFVEASQAFAKRILALEAKDDADRMAQALQLCVAREPSDFETQKFIELLEKSRVFYAKNPEPAQQLLGEYQPEGTEPAEAAAWVAVARIALNLDELITRE
ncbi:MAG: hypothetical protein ACI8UO_001706 [Verrucomicrobiales bacterium]|jgi:hypothetical protein